MQNGLRKVVFVIVVLFLGWFAFLNFKYCKLKKSYEQLLYKEELTLFEFETFQFKKGHIREVSFSRGDKPRTVRADVTLQNFLAETVSPEYKTILYDEFGMIAGQSSQNWIFSALKPGEIRKQDFTFSCDGTPKYFKLFDRTKLERE
ncbi:MAG: hypothetical protein AB1650_01725 [Candidatus Omnitrophota bacterium]